MTGTVGGTVTGTVAGGATTEAAATGSWPELAAWVEWLAATCGETSTKPPVKIIPPAIVHLVAFEMRSSPASRWVGPTRWVCVAFLRFGACPGIVMSPSWGAPLQKGARGMSRSGQV